MSKQIYYSDGVTKIKDPFYVVECVGGHRYWSVTYERRCSVCGKDITDCSPPKKEEVQKCQNVKK